MKKYTGQIVFNLAAASVGVLLFKSSTLALAANPVAAGAAIVALMSAMSVGNYGFIKFADKGKNAFAKSYIVTDDTFAELVEPQDYLDAMKNIDDYPQCSAEAKKIVEQWHTFKKKSNALNTISYGGGVYEVVNQDVEALMLKNMLLFMKRVAIMQSGAAQQEMKIHKDYLKSLIASNEKILNDYTELLIEASQLTGDDLGNAEVKSLQVLIDSIKDYRQNIEKGDEKQ